MNTSTPSPTSPNKLTRIIQIFILFIGVLLFASLLRNFTTILSANKNIASVKERLEEAREKNIRLKEELQKVESREYKEKQAREQLGLSKEGEVVLILPEEETLRKLSPVILEQGEEVIFEANWKKWLRLIL